MDETDLEAFVNRARCECGQAVQVEVSATQADVNPTTIVETVFGVMCALAEESPDQFRRCVTLEQGLFANYVAGVVADVHPVWLSNGVAIGSLSRDPAEAVAAGSCVGAQGASGLWLCAQTDGIVGCQAEEYFVSDVVGLRYDYLAPLVAPRTVEVEPYSAGALVSWTTETPGDIQGYRVLCEEVGTGAPPRSAFSAPALTDAGGSHYFNAYNLCGGQPFSTYTAEARDGECGDGVLDPGEECDDIGDNRDDGLCTTQCMLAVSEALHGLDWGLVCSAHVAYNENSAVVEGLENGKTYNVVLVAYDKFGNPQAFPQVFQVTPDASLPSLSEDEDGCGCRGAEGGAWLLLPVLVGLRRRRR